MVSPHPPVAPEPDEELKLVERAQQGDRAAFGSLVEPWRKPLFGYIYRMVALRQDAEDLLQDVLIRVLEDIRSYRGEARFKSWLFGIATHACLDHLRKRKRWRVEAQLIGERETTEHPEQLEGLRDLMSSPGFVYEIREHIAFCFSCIGRSLEPDEQASVMLKEVLEFTNQEAAAILRLSEPVFRHRLSSARAKMTQAFDGLCALINKTGVCYQCQGLREIAGEKSRGPNLVQIEVAPGVTVNPESLFDARAAIVRNADLEAGTTRQMHDMFYQNLSRREESQ
ncbi:MAG TPA: RNA polymerase sigma factor [Candidatus Acidoferrales bacterium]